VPPCWYIAVRSGRSKDLEIIVLRQQLQVLRRQVERPALTDGDRTVLGAIAAAVSGVEDEQLAQGGALGCLVEAFGSSSLPHSFGVFVAERLQHLTNLNG
jgi:hypothetical protein